MHISGGFNTCGKSDSEDRLLAFNVIYGS